ncbi:MAG: acyl-CoA dehydrogenase family protein [Pseudomonadota bacterium]
MNFQPTDDHEALLDAVRKMVARELTRPPTAPTRVEYATALQQQIAEAGFFDCMAIDELGPVAAAAMVMELCRLPLCLEMVASTFIAPLACADRPGPFALVGERLDRPIRFAPIARTLIRLRAGRVDVAALDAGAVQAVDSVFAYPMGLLRDPAALPWTTVADADAATLQRLWRLGTAAELVGCLSAGLDSVLDHVKDRRQFGRPLGAFQGVQHRLATCATSVESARWLVYRAASSGTEADAAMAAGFAQDIATKVAYDLHQFMGAMGLTLEHPLHRWTYRSKLLRTEPDGAAAHFAQLADAAWPIHTEDTVHTGAELPQ